MIFTRCVTGCCWPFKYRLVLIMKLAILLTIAFTFHAVAESRAQKITLNLTNAPLSKVMSEIQKQQGYSFLFHGNHIADIRVDVRVKQMDFADAMEVILNKRGLEWTLEDGIVSIIASKARSALQISGQQKIISGKVIDEEGNPLEAVTVLLKDTQQQTLTDSKGNFQFPAGATGSALVFSAVGFKEQEVTLTDQFPMTVKLSAAIGELEEVVIVGMNNRQTKRSVTGAMATIQTKELRQSPVANLSNALAGRLPGLITVQSTGQPGDDGSALYIRGVSTYGNTSPLVVIDGLPRSQANFSQLDPNEIESVTILKDASSTSLYGIQGANGVIVVTTRRGISNEQPQVSFTAQQAFQQPVRLPRQMDALQQALYYNEYDINDGRQPRFDETALSTIRDKSDPYLYPDVDWYREILRSTSSQNQYNLNISGGANAVRYFISGSYIRQGSLLKHDQDNDYKISNKFDRYNFRSNVDIDVTKRLRVQVDLAGRLENRTGPGPGFQQVFSILTGISPLAMPVFNPDGSFGAGSAAVVPGDHNPYGLIARSGYYTNYNNVMYGTLSARHDLDFIGKGLSAQLFFSFENDNQQNTSRTQDFDSFWYRGSDAAGEPIYQQYTIGSRLATSGQRFVTRYDYLDFRLNYDRSWEDHALTAQVLGNRTLRVVNDELPYAYQGVSARITYNFKSKYYLEGNVGYNGSENFPENRRYGLFPAVSAGWVLSSEPFLSDSKTISFLKLRGSYGIVGNDLIGGERWLFISDYAPGGGYYTGISPTYIPGYNENRTGNPIVTWERSTKINAGVDLSLFSKGEVQLTFDVFKELRTNILTAPGTVPDYIGVVSLAPRNTGEVENKGFEVELRLTKTVGEVNLFSTMQLTYARNKVLRNDQPSPAMPYQSLVGYEVGYALGYKFAGFFSDADEIANSPRQSFSSSLIPGDAKYVDVNGDNVVDARDRVPVLLQNIPRYVGGFSVGGSWKGFDLSLLFNGALGGTANIRLYQPGSAFQLQRWTPENKEKARVPVAHLSANNTDILSDLNLQRTDYLKLRNVEVGYVLPQNFIHRFRLVSARVFLNGQNVGIWDRLWFKDRDPESPGGDVVYPIQRVYNVGLALRF